MEPKIIFTIGHSNYSPEAFVALLKSFAVQVLVDIRSEPYSKYVPHFNPKLLKPVLVSEGIKYLFLGKELGGRPSDREYYDAEGRVLYWRLAGSPLFLDGVARLEKGARDYRIALMCSEEDPSECHRHLLVAHVLKERGFSVHHIRGDGSAETDDKLTSREANRGVNPLQPAPFELPTREGTEWKSIQSVLRKEQHQASSER